MTSEKITRLANEAAELVQADKADEVEALLATLSPEELIAFEKFAGQKEAHHTEAREHAEAQAALHRRLAKAIRREGVGTVRELLLKWDVENPDAATTGQLQALLDQHEPEEPS